MTTLAPSAAPPNAHLCWVDDVNVYIEIKSKSAPYIAKFALSEGGLSKALNMLRESHKAFKVNGGTYKIPEPDVTKIVRGKAQPKVSEDQRESARNVLKKMKII